MAEQRRYEDTRMDKLEKNIDEMSKDLVLVKQKIFNGFSHSIESTENKVNYIDERNTKEHNEIRVDMKGLSAKMDRLLWKLVLVTFFAMVVSYFVR